MLTDVTIIVLGEKKKTLIGCVHLQLAPLIFCFCLTVVKEIHPSNGEAHCGGLSWKPPL